MLLGISMLVNLEKKKNIYSHAFKDKKNPVISKKSSNKSYIKYGKKSVR